MMNSRSELPRRSVMSSDPSKPPVVQYGGRGIFPGPINPQDNPISAGNNLDAIHDITVAYPHNIPQTEKHILHGNFPKEIHFHVRRYPVSSLPASKEDLQLWCQERWKEKEERLRTFYEGEKYFDVTRRSRIPPCKSELRVHVIKFASLLYWTTFIVVSFYLIYLYSIVRWYTVFMIVVYVLQEKYCGGLELIELACHRYHTARQAARGKQQ
ncbi:unnamed protein product [Ranitomeya imitator]|uniref:Acyltransferase C-terminal domain-containing protein n=1 Tax=Ranitomeya imitator TaxID=111125 RepID=A0ABN9L0F8_9NEOB|nr:unnamed protein product [Ranitomeya imitator]